MPIIDTNTKNPRRFSTIETFHSKVEKAEGELVSSTREDVDPFQPALYQRHGLIVPPFTFGSLYRAHDESDVLTSCIAAMQKNVDGFGYRLDFLGDDRTEIESAEAKAQAKNVTAFFDEPNPDHSFLTIRNAFRKDYEILGQGALEVVRFRSGGISALYYIPMMELRMTILDAEPTTLTSTLFRDGRERRVTVKKRFRRFAQVLYDGWSLKWFKTLGDPRIMDATTGKYVNSRREAKEVASEILLIQQPTSGRTYGVPRWIANATDIRGRSNAQYINWSIGENQGIPPMMLIVQNGTLNDDSKKELQRWAESMRGADNFNRIGLLEAIPELHGLDDKGTVKVDLKNLTEYRSDDLMFGNYLKSTSDCIRQAFRLPDLYLGGGTDASYASSYVAQRIAESQVFVPERLYFDEVINNFIVQKELHCDKWKYVTQGPQTVSAEELRLSMKEFTASGAISANNAIDILNDTFGSNVSKYKEPWADYPFSLVRTQCNNGTMVIPEITNSDPKTPSKAPEKPSGKPNTSDNKDTAPLPSSNARGY